MELFCDTKHNDVTSDTIENVSDGFAPVTWAGWEAALDKSDTQATQRG